MYVMADLSNAFICSESVSGLVSPVPESSDQDIFSLRGRIWMKLDTVVVLENSRSKVTLLAETFSLLYMYNVHI